jgi:general secretion pathway protein I
LRAKGWRVTKLRSVRSAGFTLVEVLVALAVVSIALLAALRAAGQGASSLEDLRSRVLAGWIAENRLAEHRGRGDWMPPGVQRGSATQAGLEFTWREEVTATPSPSFRRLDIFVSAAPDASHSLARLTGFLSAPEARR